MNIKFKGFTLIELVTVVAIAGILLGVGVPNMQSLITSAKVTSNVNKMVGLLNYSREYSLNNNVVVTVCPSSDGISCSKYWTKGQIAFTDKNLNHKKDAGEIVLRAYSELPEKHVMTWRAFQNKNYLQYSPTGFTRYQNGTFRFCVLGEDKSFNRAIIMTISGRARSSKDIDGDGIHEDRTGKDVVCR